MAEFSERKRKARLRRRLSYVIAVVVTSIITVIIYTKSGLLQYQVATYVNDHYLANTPFEFSCERIRGNYFENVVLVNPVLRYHSRDASFNVFRADRVAFSYDLFKVLQFNLDVDDLQLDNVHVQLRKDSDGKLALPARLLGGGAKTGGRRVAPGVNVDKFAVNGLHLSFGGGEHELAVRDVDLTGAIQYRNGVGRLRVDRGNAYVIESGTALSSIALDVETRGDAVTLREFRVRTNESSISATGAIRNSRLDHVQLVFNPVNLDELHHVGLAPDLGGGEFGGSCVVSGVLDSLDVSGVITGTGFGVTLGGLEFEGSIANDHLRFARVNGSVFGSHVDGSFSTRLVAPADYSFNGSVYRLDLSQGFVADMPPTSLSGDADIAFDAASERMSIAAALDSATIDGYECGATSFRGEWSPHGLDIERLVARRPGYTLDARGTIDSSGVMDFVASADANDLTYLWEFFGLEPVRGAFAGTARVQGTPEDLQVNLSGDATDIGFLFATIDSGTVQGEFTDLGSDTATVRIGIEGRHIDLDGRVFNEPRIYLSAANDLVHVTQLRFARGDTVVVGAFDVRTESPTRQEITLRRLTLDWAGETWRARTPVAIAVDNGTTQFDSIVLSSHRGTVGAAGHYADVGDIDVSTWGRDVDLGLLREFLPRKVRLSGRGTFSSRVRGSVDNPAVSLRADIVSGTVDSLSFDRLRFAGEFDRRYRVSDATLIVGDDTLQASGTWRYGRSPLRLASADSSALVAAGIDASVVSRHFPLAVVQRALHLPVRIGGEFDGDVRLTGSLGDPIANASGRLEPRPGAGGLSLPPVTLDIGYAEGVLAARHIEVEGTAGPRISGSTTLGVALGRGAHPSGDGSLKGAFDVSLADLSWLRPYVSGFDQLGGSATGHVALSGTIRSPLITGNLKLRDGVIKARTVSERFREVNADVIFDGHVIRLTSLTARSGEEGSLFASGTMGLSGFKPKEYQLDISMRSFRLRSIPDVDATVNADLKVATVQSGGRRVPNVRGKVDVVKADIIADLGNAGGSGTGPLAPTDTPAWLANIDINGDNNIWLTNPDMRIEVRGRLILVREGPGLYLRGDMDAIRGSYRVYGNKFKLVDGSLNFSTVAARPGIVLNAYTPHRDDQGLERRIYLAVNWPADQEEPTITLSYDKPGYTQEDLWAMLGGSTFGSGLAFNQMERFLNSEMTGLDIDIGRRQASNNQASIQEEVTIGVGRYLWEDLYVRFQRGLTVRSEQEVQVEYRLSNLFLLRSEFLHNSTRGVASETSQSTDEFTVDIKFRWEY